MGNIPKDLPEGSSHSRSTRTTEAEPSTRTEEAPFVRMVESRTSRRKYSIPIFRHGDEL